MTPIPRTMRDGSFSSLAIAAMAPVALMVSDLP